MSLAALGQLARELSPAELRESEAEIWGDELCTTAQLSAGMSLIPAKGKGLLLRGPERTTSRSFRIKVGKGKYKLNVEECFLTNT